MDCNEAWVGLDVGSTTVKVAVVEPESGKLIHSTYMRHNADQTAAARDLLREVDRLLRSELFLCDRPRVAVCGSGGRDIAERLGAFYVQEVVATAAAVAASGLLVQSVIELGGQDAKVIFFRDEDGRPVPHEMRMNGSCAGGTGAFIDQIAELLHVPVEQFDELARKGVARYDVSGRCGVFAKTDIQPLLHQGAPVEDIAVSSFHAIAKQTIGGLAQGLHFEPPVLFAGGPLTFNPTLIAVFKERLSLTDDQIVVPDRPEIFVARGAALSIGTLFAGKANSYRGAEAAIQPAATGGTASVLSDVVPQLGRPFFGSEEEKEDFLRRHGAQDTSQLPEQSTSTELSQDQATKRVLRCYLGIDAGSTTTKFVLLDENLALLYRFYSANERTSSASYGSDSLAMTRDALIAMRDEFSRFGTRLDIRAVCTTGYGETLFAAAFGADIHQVETVAHARAATQYLPDASFVLDIGGQDMKAIELHNGVITNITLNEACSAGCGSFLETYARSLGVPVDGVAPLAFQSQAPSHLGSRCTVFMNSSVITEQKNGRSKDDVLAGLCRSIIENVFTKVIRMSNLQRLGDKILVQGGTFRNLAVLRAMEEFVGKPVYRPPYPGEMGAIGAALLAHEWAMGNHGARRRSSFIGLDELESFRYERKAGVMCAGCANNCSRTVVTFAGRGERGTTYHVTGNRCERGLEVGDSSTRRGAAGARREATQVAADLMREHAQLLVQPLHATDAKELPTGEGPGRGTTIGIPRVLEFYRSLPYWRTLFTALGFRVQLSGRSTYRMFEAGLPGVASDTVCFPAKLVHGHVLDLVKCGVDRIFLPMMIRIPKENRKAQGAETCPIVQGYPVVAAKSEETRVRFGIPMDTPAFHFFNRRLERRQTMAYLSWLIEEIRDVNENGCTVASGENDRATSAANPALTRLIRRAVALAEKAQDSFVARMRARGSQVLEQIDRRAASGENAFAVVLAGRPYHADELVNHGLPRLFTSLGIPVLNLESLSGLESEDVTESRLESFNPFHTRMIAAAKLVAKRPNLELVQIVSFGCGHDAILSDEVSRILRESSGKDPLVLKLDEGEATGPLSIRVRSFVETVRTRRSQHQNGGGPRYRPPGDGFGVRFTYRDVKRRTVYAPYLSAAFSYMAVNELRKVGFKAQDLPMADNEAIALGKRYVHNDVCFPAQVNIGEMLRLLKSGTVDPNHAALGLAKNCTACRAGQYAGLARKALDDAGFPQVPIVTTGRDTKHIHPGAKINPVFHLDMLVGMTIADGMEEMRQTTRPYEQNRGETDSVFAQSLARCTDSLKRSWRAAFRAFDKAVEAFNAIPVNEFGGRPKVGIVGEILMNYHESANGRVQRYLEDHGMETVVPGLVDFFRKKDIVERSMADRGMHPMPIIARLVTAAKERAFELARDKVEGILEGFTRLRPRHSFEEIQHNIDGIIDKSYLIGEGWLMPAEIIQMAKEGVRSFVILNPFGCMPNHITGRGMIKTLKQLFPTIRVLALDYDPDTSWGNIENRLQMLIMSAAP